MVTIKKKSVASQSNGRGMDNTYQSGTYGIYAEDGTQIGYIMADKRRYMEPANWNIQWLVAELAGKSRTKSSFREAKAYALDTANSTRLCK